MSYFVNQVHALQVLTREFTRRCADENLAIDLSAALFPVCLQEEIAPTPFDRDNLELQVFDAVQQLGGMIDVAHTNLLVNIVDDLDRGCVIA